MELEAINLRGNRWGVRPVNQLGTCGWYPKPWEIRFVTARNAEEAIRKVTQQGHKHHDKP